MVLVYSIFLGNGPNISVEEAVEIREPEGLAEAVVDFVTQANHLVRAIKPDFGFKMVFVEVGFKCVWSLFIYVD